MHAPIYSVNTLKEGKTFWLEHGETMFKVLPSEVISNPSITSDPDHPQSSAGFCNLFVYRNLRKSLLRSDATFKPPKPLLAFEAASATSNAHRARAPSSGELQNPGVLQLAQVEYIVLNATCYSNR
jgi:hypothetical protein